MPTMPLPKCSVSICLKRVVDKKKSFCDEHQKLYYIERSKYESDPFYWSKAWRRARLQALARDEYQCVECKKKNVVTVANTVDHIVPRKEGGPDFELSNLQSLCEMHHNMKRAKEGGTLGRRPDVSQGKPMG